MKANRLNVLILVGCITAITACTRSNEFKRDQEFYKPENPSYYDRQANKSATQALEVSAQPKKRVLVLNFWNDTPVRAPLVGGFAAEELRRNLAASQRVIIQKDSRDGMNTEDYISGERVKVSQLIREGRRLGLSVIIIGRITKIVFRRIKLSKDLF